MSYLKILSARRKSGKMPTMEQRQWTPEQKRRIAAGCCAECGERPPARSSYICPECQAGDTIEDIRSELSKLRDRLLHRREE